MNRSPGSNPCPSPALLRAAAAELQERAAYGAFRDRMWEQRKRWEGYEAVAAWLLQQASHAEARP